MLESENATLAEDHRHLRNVLRSWIRRKRELFSKEGLEADRFYQYYTDAAKFERDFPTHKLRFEFVSSIEEGKKNETKFVEAMMSRSDIWAKAGSSKSRY